MEMSFRWYGTEDPVKLEQIKQIPAMKGIVSAIYELPPGETWPRETIRSMKAEIEQRGLVWNVVESVPVHEDIKMGKGTRDSWIAKYQETIRNLSREGIKTICYNFMPVFDWTRSKLDAPLPDGSHSLMYDEDLIQQIDPLDGSLTLPGWDLSYQKDDLRVIMEEYKEISKEDLMENLIYFLERIIPVAEEEDVLMAIHPDDPPWDIFGLPRIITNEANVMTMLKRVNSRHNGITFCTGSYGADQDNDLIGMIEHMQDRIHFVHARNVRWTSEKSFQETSHSVHEGSLDMVGIIQKLIEVGYEGPIRPDHGRMIWGEEGRPGYGLYDRALGAVYLNGIIDAERERR
ncbi:mannonate dehydratase [Marinococcus halophilus]|uniref:Mannonate dehydratase n=1 Tax=Marinococcus halophilus TaxID=1371 RepID=A0A510Y4I4_MARHA|nr:mannonate dehydratase [Marinococcus halophilus]OZT80196.1 mannonate dehydratase [Marinococcus halophilus]GEK58249.1 mannonate dehydratase [Marinococcus halophilus]